MPKCQYQLAERGPCNATCAIRAAQPAGAQQTGAADNCTILPDGSAFAVGSFPLPQDHWLYAPHEYEPGADEPKELLAPILTHAQRNEVVAAVRYAVRGATMCGKEPDFDPDALVQNAVYALCGSFGRTALVAPAQTTSSDAYEGAREDLSIWKRRALKAERDLRTEKATTARLVAELNANNGPTRMGEPATQPALQQAAQEPTAISEAIERMAADRYNVVPSHESMFHRWSVVAGTGTQQLYLGREVECQNMARKFAGAFLDGAFVAMQQAAPQPSPAAQGDALDAERLDWLTFNLSGKALRDIGVVWSEHGDARRAIDAARAAQEGKSHDN